MALNVADMFPEVKKNFGFGCMRLPMLENGEVDIEQCKMMADEFIENGFNYFDTAHGYIDGKSELAIKEFLTKRYPREKYLLTNKLTGSYFEKEEDIRPYFETQLEACGVDYFDFYLMHAQNKGVFEKFKKCNAYETALKFKEEGKIKHFGISFHDSAEVLDRILTEYPQIEIVQIQFNYVDYDDSSVQSGKVYQVCEKHNKPVIVMEPVKGGTLVNLPEDAQKVFDELQKGAGTNYSNASYAIRYVADFPNMRMILSGMSNIDQMRDNISYMKDYKHLTGDEKTAIKKVSGILTEKNMIQCTSCHYCVEENHCPKDILIPDMFSVYNAKKRFNDWNQDYYYESVLTAKGHAKASECIKCGKCEQVCPQQLPIRKLLAQVAEEFEK